MFKRILLLLSLCSSLAYADFKTMSTQEVQEAIKNNVAVIDVRRVDEWNRYGIIKGSHKITFFDAKGKYYIDKWMNQFTKIVTTKDQPFILVCAHANRTKVIAKFLNKKLQYTNVNELQGGINYGWIDKGLKTVK